MSVVYCSAADDEARKPGFGVFHPESRFSRSSPFPRSPVCEIRFLRPPRRSATQLSCSRARAIRAIRTKAARTA